MTKRKANLRTVKKNHYGLKRVLARHFMSPLTFGEGVYDEIHACVSSCQLEVCLVAGPELRKEFGAQKTMEAYLVFEPYRRLVDVPGMHRCLDGIVEQLRNGIIPAGLEFKPTNFAAVFI